MKFALLIPIYEPNDDVLPFLKTFKEGDFDYFLCVNDGSNSTYNEKWEKIKSETLFDVISYNQNKGKGYALKQGIKKIIKEHPEIDYILTADGDGQHLLKDILNIKAQAELHSEALILGTRDFANVPAKSKSGNTWSARYFKLATGKKLSDVQTGLRAIHKSMFQTAILCPGTRYEYEMNFLMEVARNFEIEQVPIETVYINNNAESHFRPFIDSMRFMIMPILYLLVSVGAWAIDTLIFGILERTVYPNPSLIDLLAMVMISRAISAPFQFFMLRYAVFHTRGKFLQNAAKYFALAFASAFVSWGLIWTFDYYLKSLGFGYLVYVKMLIDFILGVAKYFFNLSVIFANKIIKKKSKPKE